MIIFLALIVCMVPEAALADPGTIGALIAGTTWTTAVIGTVTVGDISLLQSSGVIQYVMLCPGYKREQLLRSEAQK